jgi:hypothetical protein
MLKVNFHENDMMLFINSTSCTAISKFYHPDLYDILLFTYDMYNI